MIPHLICGEIYIADARENDNDSVQSYRFGFLCMSPEKRNGFCYSMQLMKIIINFPRFLVVDCNLLLV